MCTIIHATICIHNTNNAAAVLLLYYYVTPLRVTSSPRPRSFRQARRTRSPDTQSLATNSLYSFSSFSWRLRYRGTHSYPSLYASVRARVCMCMCACACVRTISSPNSVFSASDLSQSLGDGGGGPNNDLSEPPFISCTDKCLFVYRRDGNP